MMKPEGKKLSISFAKLFISFLMILLLTLSIISIQISSKQQEENEKILEQNLAKGLDEIISKTAMPCYIKKSFDKLINAAKQKGPASEELEEIVHKIFFHDNIAMKAFFYDNNVLKKSINANQEEIELFRELLEQLSKEASETDFIEANRKPHERLLSIFGAGNRLELIKLHKGYVTNYIKNGREFHYHWDRYEKGLGIFFFTTKNPDFITRFTNVMKDTANKNFGAISSDGKTIIPPLSFTEDQTLLAYLKSTKSNKAFIDSNDHFWYFQTTKSGEKICHSIPIKDATNGHDWIEQLQFFSTLSFILIFLIYLTALIKVFPGKNLVELMDNSSIRFRIVGIFSMASVFPVIMAIVIGISAVSDKEKVMEKNILSESLASIYNMEHQYKILMEKTEAMSVEIREYVKQASINKRPINEEMFERFLIKYGIASALSRIDIRDNSIKTILSLDDRKIHSVAEVIDLICRIAIKEHSPHRLDNKSLGLSPAELVSESVLSTDELGFATIIRQRGKQWFFKAGPFPTTWYWDVYPELATGPAFICITTQLITTFKQQLEDYIYSLPPSSSSIQLGVFISALHYSDKLISPYKNLPTEEILNIANAAFYTNRVLFRSIDIEGKAYWITAKAENKVASHILVNLISKKERLAALEPFKWQLGIIGLFTLTISLFGAWYITNLIILPVGDLSKGILAIRRRIKDFRIPVRRNDEFGKLATAFNEVIGSLKELEYGKFVQESLLPPSAPKIEGYDIAYFNISATDLAGDYHDHTTLEDGNLAIILGDVSGHGISASLAMAMAKANFNYAKSLKVKFPEELMDMLNLMFNKELKPRNKLMTLVSVVLNPENGEAIFDNAGQCYPLFYSAHEGNSEELQMPSLPLGGMKKRKRKSITKVMKSNDAFILYTDGIVECSSAKGEVFGYKRLFNKFTQLMKEGTYAKEALQQLFQEMEDFREPGPRDDDVTLIIVRKL